MHFNFQTRSLWKQINTIKNSPNSSEIIISIKNLLKKSTVVMKRKSGKLENCISKHSQKKRKVNLEIRLKLAFLRTYVEKRTILEPILLYSVSKCKQTKEEVLVYQCFSFFCQDANITGWNCYMLHFLAETQISTAWKTEQRDKLHISQDSFL